MVENTVDLDGSLLKAISETVESMTFEEAKVVNEEDRKEYSDKNLMWSKVSVLQPVSGSVSLEVPRALTELFGEDVYGDMDDGSSNDWMFDVLGEILNTVTGSFMKQIFPDRQFQIGLPETGTGRSPKAEGLVINIQLNIGEYFLTARLFGEDFDNFENKS